MIKLKTVTEKRILICALEQKYNNLFIFKYLNYHSDIMISGGNFHGQYPAQALDVLAIAIQDLGTVSEVKK